MKDIEYITKKRDFSKKLLITSLPVILQQLLQNSLSFADTIMIGQLGSVEIASVGLCNQIYFLISVVIFGIASGASIFTSQYWGSRDMGGFRKTVGVALSISFLIVSVFAFLSVFSPALLMRLFVDDDVVVEIGCRYLRIVGISYFFVSVSMVFSIALRSSGDMVNPTKATFISLIFNLILNYFLIFPFGLGVVGAAIATTISRFAELAILFMIVRKSKLGLNFRTIFDFDFIFVKQILKTAFPVIIDDFLWALGMTVYKAVYSRMGIGILAAANVSESVQNLIFVVQDGMGAAISVMIGNEIGRSNEDNAQFMAKRSLVISLYFSLLGTVLLAVLSPFVPLLFKIDSEVRLITTYALLAMAAGLPFKFNNHTAIVGIMRSGGDTNFILFTEIFSIWCVGVPLAILGGLVLKLELWEVYILILGEEIAKMIIIMPRLLKGKWINNLT